MFTPKIVSLLLLVPNNLQNFLSGDTDSIYIRFKNINAGNDERYYTVYNKNSTSSNSDNNDNNDNNEHTDAPFMIHKIRRNIINKNIIEELENNSTNIHQKIDIIEKYTDLYQNKISGFNLLAVKLLDEFYDVI